MEHVKVALDWDRSTPLYKIPEASKESVCIITPWLKLGGAEVQTVTLACGLAARGYAVTLVCRDDSDVHPPFLERLERAGVRYIVTRDNPDADVTLWWGASNGPVGPRSIFIAHNAVGPVPVGVGRVVSVCENPEADRVIWNGAEVEGCHTNIPPDDMRGVIFNVGYLGRMCKSKGIEVLAEAQRHFEEDEFRLWAYGEGPDAELLGDGCMGVVADPGDALRMMDCLVIPGEVEGCPMAAVEAALSKVPIVHRGQGDLDKMFGVGRGIKFDGTAHELEHKLQTLKDERARFVGMVDRAYDFAMEHLTTDRMVEQYEQVIKKVAVSGEWEVEDTRPLVEIMLDESRRIGIAPFPDVESFALTEPPAIPPFCSGDSLPVALVSHTMGVGGAERMLVTLAKGLAGMSFAPRVYNTGIPATANNPLVKELAAAKVPYMESPPTDEPVNIWWAGALREPPSGSIYIVHNHSTATERMLRRAMPAASSGVAVGVSGAAAHLAQRVLGVPARVIWNGSVPPGAPLRPHPRSDFVVGYLGRYSPEKNLAAAVAALLDLPRRVRMRFYGWGPQYAKLAALADELGVADRFDLCGVTTPLQAFADFDCFVLPSVFEGLPMTVIEAMQHRCPVAVVPHGDLSLICKDEVRGVLMESTANSIVSAVTRLMSVALLCENIAGAAEEFALEHLTAEAMVRSYAALALEVAE